MEICSPEEDRQFAEISAWCFKNRKRIKTIQPTKWDDVHLDITDKPRKQRPSSTELQRRRRAIDKLLNQER